MLLVTALIVSPVVAIFVGPASNLYATGSLQPLSNGFPGGKVVVRNPELVEELEIFQASGQEVLGVGQAVEVFVSAIHKRNLVAPRRSI